MTTMFRKWHMELWRLRKHYLCNAICHKCKASKNPGRYQKTAVGFIMFFGPNKSIKIYVFLGWDDVEYQGILKAFVKWWWGIQPFGTSTTHLGLLCPNFIQTAFLLYVPWHWLSDSGGVPMVERQRHSPSDWPWVFGTSEIDIARAPQHLQPETQQLVLNDPHTVGHEKTRLEVIFFFVYIYMS